MKTKTAHPSLISQATMLLVEVAGVVLITTDHWWSRLIGVVVICIMAAVQSATMDVFGRHEDDLGILGGD